MVKTKKQAQKQAEAAAPYVRRLLEDRYVQQQIQNAASGLRGAYGRVRNRGTDATEDKKFYGNLRQAASSIRNVATAMQQRPEPKPKRRVQKLAAAALAGGSAFLVAKQQKTRSQNGGGGTNSA